MVIPGLLRGVLSWNNNNNRTPIVSISHGNTFSIQSKPPTYLLSSINNNNDDNNIIKKAWSSQHKINSKFYNYCD